MSKFRSDGSVFSSNTPAYSKMSQYSIDREHTIYRAMVVDIYYTDDNRNVTKDTQNPSVMYQCKVIGGMNEGKLLDNCKLANYLGGQYNYAERVLRKATKSDNGDKSKKLSQQDGDIVYVGFINADSKYPLIIGLDTQPLDRDKTGATKSEGQRNVWEYNGIKSLINKAGEWIRSHFGGDVDETGVLTPSTDQTKLVEEKWSDGKVERQVGTKIKVTEDSNSGLVTIEVEGGNRVEISESGQVTIQASGKVNLTAPEVDVGDAAALSATRFEALKAEFDAHTHAIPGNLGPPVTAPPIAPLIDIIGSKTVKIND